MKAKNYNPPLPAPSVARLKVTKGPHKGVSYKLVSGKITIGRSSENDIVLMDDDKCSRSQALLSLRSGGAGWIIKDLSNKSSVKINNMIKLQADLEDGDLIQFGSTVLQFEFKVSQEAPPPVLAPMPVQGSNKGVAPPAPVPPSGDVPGAPIGGLPGLKPGEDPSSDLSPAGLPPAGLQDPVFSLKTSSAVGQNKKKRLIIISAVFVLGGGWFFLSDTENKKEEDRLRTEKQREESLKTLTELKEQEWEKRSKNVESSYKHAQFAYTRGIRDYRKGVYGRAIESFRVCKTLYPRHQLCDSYLKKAQVKHQQLIQAWMVAGKEYRKKRRFVPCMSSFKNVMMALKDKSNHLYKEAQESWKICQIQYEDRY